MDGSEPREAQWQPTDWRPYPTLTPEQQRHAEEVLSHRLSGYERPNAERER
jgi:hypothetical protein